MLCFLHFLPITWEIPITTHLHCSQELINWYSLFLSHQLFRASQMFGFNRAIDRIKFYWLFHSIVWFLYQSTHFWNGISWVRLRWYQCAFRASFYGANSFLFSFPFANMYARMSRYFELPSLSLQRVPAFVSGVPIKFFIISRILNMF